MGEEAGDEEEEESGDGLRVWIRIGKIGKEVEVLASDNFY